MSDLHPDGVRPPHQVPAERDDYFAVVQQMSAAFADVPFDEIEAEAAKALAEVRADMRRERAAKSESTAP